MPSSKNTRKFLVSWCNEGLEVLYDLTDWEKNNLWNILKETTDPSTPKLNMMIMRARANAQRQYEIYLFQTDDLDTGQVTTAFEEEPQFMADFIRQNGTKIYSDYYPKHKQKIQ
jgi:hypothetical protein